ncbi:MAG: hypothetical protein ABSG07_21310 [Terriglobales bacterium]|jgi:hypothetical protein
MASKSNTKTAKDSSKSAKDSVKEDKKRKLEEQAARKKTPSKSPTLKATEAFIEEQKTRAAELEAISKNRLVESEAEEGDDQESASGVAESPSRRVTATDADSEESMSFWPYCSCTFCLMHAGD